MDDNGTEIVDARQARTGSDLAADRIEAPLRTVSGKRIFGARDDGDPCAPQDRAVAA